LQIVRTVGLFCLVLPLCAIIVIPGFSVADRAGIPIDPQVEFDESAQNAIVAWNGTDESLFLSTDLRSATPGRLLEMLPLPSSPYDIKQGNISSFKKMIGLFNEKAERLQASNSEANKRATGLGGMDNAQYTGISVTFSASIGSHDITVVHVEDQSHFAEWVQNFSTGMGVANLTTTQALNDTVGVYLGRGISYFVFDVVELAGDLKTLDPMICKFKTDFLFYPLNITGATLPDSSRTDHRIRVFLVMDGVLEDPYSESLGNLTHGAGFYEYIQFSHGELGQVSEDIGRLFPADAFVAYAQERGFGSMDRVLGDIVIRPGDIHRPTAEELNRQEFKVAIRPLSPSLAYYLLLSTVEPSSGAVGLMMGAMVAGLLFAPFVLGIIFSSIMDGQRLRKKDWAAWLAVYLAGMTLMIFAIFNLGLYQGGTEGSGVNGLMGGFGMILILLIPLCVALALSDLIRHNQIIYAKNRVRAVAYGMGTVQSLALLFLPNETVAMLSGVLCFPSMLVLGIVVLLFVIVRRAVRFDRDRSQGPSPPAR
jgi:hypothetical protein